MAERTPGIYFRLDASYDTDEAIWVAGPMAELLFIRGMAYAKRKQTDGLVPRSALVVVGNRIPEPLEDLIARLVAVGLWTKNEDSTGWLISGWGKWQMTSQEVEERRGRNKRNALNRHHQEGRHQEKPHPDCELCASRMQDASDVHATSDLRPHTETPPAASRSRGNPGSLPHESCSRCDGSGWVDQGNRTVSRCPGYLRSVPAEEAS